MTDKLTDQERNERVARLRGYTDSPPREHYHEASVLYAVWQPLQQPHTGRAPAFISRGQLPSWSTDISLALRDLWPELRHKKYTIATYTEDFPVLGVLRVPGKRDRGFQSWPALARLLTEAWVEMKEAEKREGEKGEKEKDHDREDRVR